MKMARMAIVLGAAVALTACAPQPKYAWGSYEPALYTYYKTPAAADAFAEQLNKSITTAEATGKVPPGLYAEYGNMLLEQGKGKEAAVYFEKEKKAWPESAALMTRMVQLASAPDASKNKAQATAQATAPAGTASSGASSKQ